MLSEVTLSGTDFGLDKSICVGMIKLNGLKNGDGFHYDVSQKILKKGDSAEVGSICRRKP
jgi:hypothetical protein